MVTMSDNTTIPSSIYIDVGNKQHDENKEQIDPLNPNKDPYRDFITNSLFVDECKNTKKITKESFKERLEEDNKKQDEIKEERRLHPINFDGIIGHEDLKEEILLAILG